MDGISFSFHSVVRFRGRFYLLFFSFFYSPFLYFLVRAVVACRMDIVLRSFMVVW